MEMTARMSWYRMFDRIQSVRVMGVVESFRMTPFCRSSAFMFTAPDRLDVITDIAMMPGTKNSMKRYFRVSSRGLDRLDEGRLPGHRLVHHREAGLEDLDAAWTSSVALAL